MITVFRICVTKYAARAFDGEGARRYGGRWSSRGTRIVYTAGSLALAALEILVNLKDEALLHEYSYIVVRVPSRLIVPVNELCSLPSDWNNYPAPLSVKEIGDRWVRERTSAVLQVPASVVPLENNYLINPAHPDFPKIRIDDPQRFVFDERLLWQTARI